MQKLYFFWGELKSSFWFIPILIIIITIGIAFGVIYIDSLLDYKPEGIFQYVFTGSVDSARSILSIISGAMIGVAGTVFSITLVALTLASSQFGPRLLRNFMHERMNQVVLGSYISTYVYCLIVLSAIKDNDLVEFIPTLSVLGAILAAISNIVLLIFFIHHIAMSIQADKVISDIYNSISKNITVLFPEKLGEDTEKDTVPDFEALKNKFPHQHAVAATESGYLKYVDNQLMMSIACEHDLLINLKFRPGNYIVKDIIIAVVYSKYALEEKVIDQLQNILIVGKVRTPQQDAEFSIHQMVEIAVRALSPGINDPYTAIACIDNLTSTMCHLTKVKFPSKYRYDEEGEIRVIAETLTYEGMLDTAFNQIRQFGGGSPSVIIRMMEALGVINKFATKPSQHKTIKKHAEMILRLAKHSFQEENDLNDLLKRSDAILGEEE